VKFLERLRKVTDEYADRFTLAEVGGDHALGEMQAFTAGTQRLHSAYGFDFLYAEQLTPGLVAQVAREWPENSGWPSWAFENHDAPRALSRWVGEAGRQTFAHAKMLLLATLRGSIILYQGEELGLSQADVPFDSLRDPEAIANWPLTLSRDGARTPMPWNGSAPHLGFSTGEPWLPPASDHGLLAVDRQDNRSGSMLTFTRECLALRKRFPALREGSMEIVESGDAVLQFERACERQRLRCTFNLSDRVVAFRPSGAPLINVGEVGGESLGAYSALIEEIG
jgi:alpha-glucosidase